MKRRKFFNLIGSAILGTIISLELPSVIAPILEISAPKARISDILNTDYKVLSYIINLARDNSYDFSRPIIAKISVNRMKNVYDKLGSKYKSGATFIFDGVDVVENGIEYFNNSILSKEDSIELIYANYGSLNINYNYAKKQVEKEKCMTRQ